MTIDHKKLKQISKKYSVKYTDKGNGHVQIHGKLLVNYYPDSKNKSAYIAGTTVSKKDVSIENAFIMSISVPALLTKKAKRKNSYVKEKRKLLKKYPFCHWCHDPLSADTATLEHKIPLAIGGLNNFNNYTLACDNCNKKRGCSMPEITANL